VRVQTCQQCDGEGVSKTPCGVCGGESRVRRPRKIRVTVPAGVEDGMRLRIPDEGGVGRKNGPVRLYERRAAP
jgi:molecular chaperone DnaJ